MAFQAVPKGMQASLVYVDSTVGTFIGENVLNFEKTGIGDVDTGDCIALADFLSSWWVAEIEPITNINADLGRIDVKSLEVAEAPYTSLTCGFTGDQTGDIMPIQNCITIAHQTGTTGRSARGRTYIMGLGESQVTGSYLNSGVATAFQDAFDVLRVNAIGDGFRFSVLSRYTNGAPRATGVLRGVTSSGFTDLKIDTQRRRIQRL